VTGHRGLLPRSDCPLRLFIPLNIRRPVARGHARFSRRVVVKPVHSRRLIGWLSEGHPPPDEQRVLLPVPVVAFVPAQHDPHLEAEEVAVCSLLLRHRSRKASQVVENDGKLARLYKRNLIGDAEMLDPVKGAHRGTVRREQWIQVGHECRANEETTETCIPLYDSRRVLSI